MSEKPEEEVGQPSTDSTSSSLAIDDTGVLSKLSGEDFKTFSSGGVLLMNKPKARGYDFVIGDGHSITFYKVDCNFAQSDVSNQDAEEFFDLCKLEFETVQGREENVFTDWRLVFFTFRSPHSEALHPNLFFIGPEQIAKMFPPTFLKRLEFSKYKSEVEMFEHLKTEMKEAVKDQLDNLVFLEDYLKGERNKAPDAEDVINTESLHHEEN